MKEVTIIKKNIKQTQFHLFRGYIKIKFPFDLTPEEMLTLEKKFTTVAHKLSNIDYPLKAFYKMGTPYLFMNKTLEDGRKETVFTYEMDKL